MLDSEVFSGISFLQGMTSPFSRCSLISSLGKPGSSLTLNAHLQGRGHAIVRSRLQFPAWTPTRWAPGRAGLIGTGWARHGLLLICPVLRRSGSEHSLDHAFQALLEWRSPQAAPSPYLFSLLLHTGWFQIQGRELSDRSPLRALT